MRRAATTVSPRYVTVNNYVAMIVAVPCICTNPSLVLSDTVINQDDDSNRSPR
jgi:hypothetical protein